MSLLERNMVTIGLIVVLIAAAVTVAGLSITRAMLVDGYEVTAEFEDAAGLREGDAVLVAGVRQGRVLDLEIAGDRVEATLLIEGAELGADTTARVMVETLVGKRVVQLDAGRGFAEALDDGDRIPLERTSTTVDVPEFGDEAEELLSEVDSEALNTFLVALDDVVRGQREELADLIDGGTDLSEVVIDQESELRGLLRELEGLGDTLNERDEELVGIIDDVDVALGRLNERHDDLRRLLRATRSTTATAADLVGDKRGELDRILSDLHGITDVLDRHQRDLAEGLAYMGDAVLGYSSITLAHGQPVDWGKVFVQSLGPAGVDTLLGCGGEIDKQLDALFGPDPRSCAEQEGRSFPDDVDDGDTLLPPPPDAEPDASGETTGEDQGPSGPSRRGLGGVFVGPLSDGSDQEGRR